MISGVGLASAITSGSRRHALEHVRLQHAAGRQAEEDVRPVDDLGERARGGLTRVDGLPAVHQRFTTFIDDAFDVADDDIFAPRAEGDEEIERGERGRACAGADDLDLVDGLSGQLERVGDRGRDDDGGAVLIVMEDRNAHAGLCLLLDLEAFRALDVLKIDAAEGRLERGDDVDELVDVGFRDLDVEHVDAGEFLEQDSLAFHDRLGGKRTDRAKAQNGGPVGEDGDEILAGGVEIGGVRVGGDGLAREGDPRRVGERQIALVGERLRRHHLELSRPGRAVEMQRLRLEIGGVFVGHRLSSPGRRQVLPHPPSSNKGGAAGLAARVSSQHQGWATAWADEPSSAWTTKPRRRVAGQPHFPDKNACHCSGVP